MWCWWSSCDVRVGGRREKKFQRYRYSPSIPFFFLSSLFSLPLHLRGAGIPFHLSPSPNPLCPSLSSPPLTSFPAAYFSVEAVQCFVSPAPPRTRQRSSRNPTASETAPVIKTQRGRCVEAPFFPHLLARFLVELSPTDGDEDEEGDDKRRMEGKDL